jgi:hypothetical protein
MPRAERPRKSAIALFRCSSGKRFITRARLSGPTAALARPSRARASASWAAEAEKAAMAEAATIPALPKTRIRRRP